MRVINKPFSGCMLLLFSSSCSLLTEWPPVNEGAGGKADKFGGAAGGGPSVGEASVGGTTSRGEAAGAGGSSDAAGGASGIIGDKGGAGSIGGNAVAAGAGGSSNGGTPGTANAGSTSMAIAGAPSGGVMATGGSSATAGMAGNASTLSIAVSTLPVGRTGVAYSATLTASGAATYAWSIASGTLPAGISLQNTSAAALIMAGTPQEAGLFPLTFSVSDGMSTKSVTASLAVTHRVAFLADRVTPGVKEVFLSEVGTEVPGTPLRFSARITAGGVTDFAWSPDGARIAYKTTSNSSLYVAAVTNPGIGLLVAQDVSGYSWINDGQVLVYHTTAGSLYVVDVTGTSFTSQEVQLPAIPTGRHRQYGSISPSPRIGEFAIDYYDSTLDNLSTLSSEAFVIWKDKSSMVAYPVAGPSEAFLSFGGFSSDGALMTAWDSNGPVVYDMSSPSAAVSYPIDRLAALWHPERHALIGQTPRNPYLGLSLHEFGSTHQAALLVDPPCLALPQAWSPNGNHVVFTCSADFRAIRNVSLTSANSDFTLLPSGFLLNAFTRLRSWGWSPDSQWIALTANRDTENLHDLFLMRWSSVGVLTKPYLGAAAPGVSGWTFAPNASSIAFAGVLDATPTNQLYLSALPAEGLPGTAVALTPSNGPEVIEFRWLQGSRALIYRANGSDGPQLHAVHIGNGVTSSPIAVSGSSPANSSGVVSFQIAPLPQ